MSIISTSNWKAWINKQPIQPTPNGTLHVKGEVVTSPTVEAALVKKIPQGSNPSILLLEIALQPSSVPTKQPQEVHYTEALTAVNPYLEITIYTSIKINNIPIIN